MLFYLSMSILLRFAFTLPLIATPITLGVWIFITAIFTSLFISIFTSSWFGLILFIIYIGGILVIFSYFAATAPNQKINISLILALLTTITLTTFMALSPFNYLIPLQPSIYSKTSSYNFSYLFTYSQTPLLLSLATLLLIALIFVVKIARRKEGPLRPFN